MGILPLLRKSEMFNVNVSLIFQNPKWVFFLCYPHEMRGKVLNGRYYFLDRHYYLSPSSSLLDTFGIQTELLS